VIKETIDLNKIHLIEIHVMEKRMTYAFVEQSFVRVHLPTIVSKSMPKAMKIPLENPTYSTGTGHVYILLHTNPKPYSLQSILIHFAQERIIIKFLILHEALVFLGVGA